MSAGREEGDESDVIGFNASFSHAHELGSGFDQVATSAVVGYGGCPCDSGVQGFGGVCWGEGWVGVGVCGREVGVRLIWK